MLIKIAADLILHEDTIHQIHRNGDNTDVFYCSIDGTIACHSENDKFKELWSKLENLTEQPEIDFDPDMGL